MNARQRAQWERRVAAYVAKRQRLQSAYTPGADNTPAPVEPASSVVPFGQVAAQANKVEHPGDFLEIKEQ